MKITRYKRAQRNLSFYRNYYEFRPPYQILLDATFCQAALKNKINISEQMPKYLNDEVKLLTTVCVVNEAEQIGHSIYGAMLIVKQFPIHKCGHEKNPIAANDCLYSLLKKNKAEHYFLATQDPDLTEKVRHLAYVPIIFIKMNAIILEKPADKAKDKAVQSQERFFGVDRHQYKTLKQLKEIESIEDSSGKKRKRKSVKGPNPLSCKKKTKTTHTNQSSSNNDHNKSDNKKKRKRNKSIPNHVKRMFHKIESDLNLIKE